MGTSIFIGNNIQQDNHMVNNNYNEDDKNIYGQTNI